MDVRKLLVLIIGMGLLAVPACAGATAYSLPVRTATLVVSSDHYREFADGRPVGPYEFYTDPQVLRVGVDTATNKVYESYVMFDAQEFLNVPDNDRIYYSLYLATMSAPTGVEYYYSGLMPDADSVVPEVSDFDFVAQIGEASWSPSKCWINETRHATCGPIPVPAVSGPIYFGWLLTANLSGPAPVEIAGIGNGYGVEGPHILVTTVPEPSSLACLGAALLLGGLHARARRRHLAALALVAALIMVAATSSIADLCSDPGEDTGLMATAGVTQPILTTPPVGFTYLPTFPRFLWSAGCAPTSGAMIVGYYDNSGFPQMYRNTDLTDALCPTGGYPHDNGIFLDSGTPLNAYPSKCRISASNEHIYDYLYLNGLGKYAWGTLDDRWESQPGTFHWYQHTPWNCVADYMGANMYFFHERGDGSAWTAIEDNFDTTAVVKWQPPKFPYLNEYGNTDLDITYGLAQYIADYAKYGNYRSKATNDIDTYDDVRNYYTRVIRGYVPSDTDNGVWPQEIVNEIDDGRPVIAILVNLHSPPSKYEIRTTQHAFPVFGYRQVMENGVQRLKLLAYDTWLEDDNLHATYRIIDFPTTEEVEYKGQFGSTTETLRRASNGQYWKVVAFSFLKINDNPRCPDPLATDAYPSGEYAGAFDIGFHLPGNSCVYYEYGSKDPNPASATSSTGGCVTLDTSGNGTLHVSSACALNMRTYHNVDAPDGYVASKVVRRVYYENPKKSGDTDPGKLVSGVVTHVVDGDNFYAEQRETRLFGIRVHKVGHGLVTGDWLDVVTGTMDTSNGERHIDATSITKTPDRRAAVEPLGMNNKNVGGGDWDYSSVTGEGQRGVNNGTGLNNVGLLVRTTGCVCTSDALTHTFSITDGSGDPIDVVVPDLITPPAVGRQVGVTAVCSCQPDGGSGLLPLLLVRFDSDITDFGECECPSGSRSSAPVRSRPEVPVVEATDIIAWALKQTDGTTVTVKACNVLDSAASGLTISDGWMANAATIQVQGNWAVNRWSTVDVTGVVTTLSGGTRAITPIQVLVYTDSRGRRYEFPVPFWRDPSGRLIGEWPYKEPATARS